MVSTSGEANPILASLGPELVASKHVRPQGPLLGEADALKLYRRWSPLRRRLDGPLMTSSEYRG